MNNYPLQKNTVPAQKSDQSKIWWAILVLTVVLAASAIVFFMLQDSDVFKDLEPVSTVKDKYVAPERYGSLSLVSQEQNLNVSEEFEVNIVMDTMDSNIVVAAVKVLYDPAALEYVSDQGMANTQDSVLNMGVVNEEQGGTIEIVRGIPGDADYLDSDDGFNGQGNLATLKFKALVSGETEINFKSDSVLVLDDGYATEMIVDFENIVIDVE